MALTTMSEAPAALRRAVRRLLPSAALALAVVLLVLAGRTTSGAGADGPVVFAVIGDYGNAGPHEGAVAALVASWQPAFIMTTGDNNYPSGAPSTIDQNVGQYYHAWIAPYLG